MELYRWQKVCIDGWEQNHFRGIVNVITGGGKTVLALAGIDRLRQRYPELKVKVVVPTIPLAEQWRKALLKTIKTEADYPGFYGGSRKDSGRCNVLIYIVNSARTGLNRHVRADLATGKHVLLIVDECHRVNSKENRRIFDFLTPDMFASPLYCSLGLSATPFSTDEDRSFLEHALGKEIYRYGLSTAVMEGVISPFTLAQVGVSFSGPELQAYDELSEQIHSVLSVLLDTHPWLKDLPEQFFIGRVKALASMAENDPEDPAVQFLLLCYQRKEVSILARERIRCCISLLENLSPSDRILIFSERIEQAKMLADMIRKRFGSNACALYHSKMSTVARKRNMDLFRQHAVRILVSCRCLDEGIDVPDANIGIVLSSSSLTRQRIQRLGRIIRRSPDKDAACLYYLYVRQSTDNRAFLPGFDDCRIFDLQYDSEEAAFSNDFYEYAANDILEKAENSQFSSSTMTELRRCLLEGLTRADYLLPRDVILRNGRFAGNRKSRNYWNVMQTVNSYFCDIEGEPTYEL